MPLDRFLIAPFNSGLRTDLKPWLVPDDAFASLRNAYVFRGRVRKRFGGILMGNSGNAATAQLFSRARILIDTTDESGDNSGTVPGTIFKIGQAFSIGTEIYTVWQTGVEQTMLDTGSTTTATYDTTNGSYIFVGAPALTAIYFYPAEPIMGICNYENGPYNNQPIYAFDTQFGYTFSNSTGWQRTGAGSSLIFTGDNTNFFWTCNYRGAGIADDALFVTNFNADIPGPTPADNIWYTVDGSTWDVFQPYFAPTSLTTGPFVQTCRIIIGFKNRLLLLNTIENNAARSPINIAYPQRCRFSAASTGPFATNAWYEQGFTDNAGASWVGGGVIDATTKEQIIGAEFIKDRLIVYFERSTWELAYTGNQVLPFRFQKINTELGSESTFSTVPFDKFSLTIGNTGVHACNGANVQRIDQNIPNEVFEIENKNEGVARVVGIRDYYTEMVYWSFPSDNENPNEMYPNRVLVYNYVNGSWAFNDDCITSFGYFEQQSDVTWATIQGTWENSNAAWNSGIQSAQFRQVTAGNQEGYFFLVVADENRNAPVMQLTNAVFILNGILALTIVDHTLNESDFILIENAQGTVGLNGNIYTVITVLDANTIYIYEENFATYTGGGTITRVSQINMLSKQFNPYIDKGKNVYIQKIDFGVLKTSKGEITVDYYPSATELSMLQAGEVNESIMGTGILETAPYNPLYYPLETVQERLWHSIYFQSEGECIQLNIYLSDQEMINPSISLAPFELEGMVLYTQAIGRLE